MLGFLKIGWLYVIIFTTGLSAIGITYFFTRPAPIVIVPPTEPSGLTKEEEDLIKQLTTVSGTQKTYLTDKEYKDLLSSVASQKTVKSASNTEYQLIIDKVDAR